MVEGSSVTVNIGFRVYEDADATRARKYRDYTNIRYDLLPDGTVSRPVVAASGTSLYLN